MTIARGFALVYANGRNYVIVHQDFLYDHRAACGAGGDYSRLPNQRRAAHRRHSAPVSEEYDQHTPTTIELESKLVIQKSTVKDTPEDWILVDW